MVYLFSVARLPEGTEDTQSQTRLLLCRGIIHQLDIYFPKGSYGLLHLHINNALHQVWPKNSGETFYGNDISVSFPESYPLLEEPYQLQAWAWNEDETYDHQVIIRIGIYGVREAKKLGYL